MSKIKILCLHGWGCSAEFMQFQLKNFEKSLPEMEFECISGPIEIPESLVGDPGVIKYSPGKKFYTWKINIFDEVLTEEKLNLSLAIDTIADYMNQKGPFDGLCGFSMGGAIAGVFTDQYEQGKLKDKLKVAFPKFVMFASANYRLISSDLLTTPSIHFCGVRDFLVDAAIQLTTRFLNPLVIIHGENHKFPKLNEHEIRSIRNHIAPVLGKKSRIRPRL